MNGRILIKVLCRLEVEEYKRLPRSEFLRNRSRKIINKFIKEGAQLTITISAEARRQVYERAENPGPTMFSLPQQEVREEKGWWEEGERGFEAKCHHKLSYTIVVLLLSSLLLPP